MNVFFNINLVNNCLMFFSANLSENYFTNRQDRYIQFRHCPEMANYLIDLTKAVADVSFRLQSDDTTTLPPDVSHPFLGTLD